MSRSRWQVRKNRESDISAESRKSIAGIKIKRFDDSTSELFVKSSSQKPGQALLNGYHRVWRRTFGRRNPPQICGRRLPNFRYTSKRISASSLFRPRRYALGRSAGFFYALLIKLCRRRLRQCSTGGAATPVTSALPDPIIDGSGAIVFSQDRELWRPHLVGESMTNRLFFRRPL